MEIDKQTLKALSSDSRIEILKILNEKRMIPADISKKLGLNSSTVVEHLHKLELAGLVRKRHTGHKWIYYEVTEKGAGIVKPKIPMQFVMVLSLGLIMAFFGIANALDVYKISWLTSSSTSVISDIGMKAVPSVSIQESALPPAAAAITPDWISIITALAGTILIIFSLYKILRRKKWK